MQTSILERVYVLFNEVDIEVFEMLTNECKIDGNPHKKSPMAVILLKEALKARISKREAETNG